eukprot:393602-Pelagomonas_calceolata.AAC.4
MPGISSFCTVYAVCMKAVSTAARALLPVRYYSRCRLRRYQPHLLYVSAVQQLFDTLWVGSVQLNDLRWFQIGCAMVKSNQILDGDVRVVHWALDSVCMQKSTIMAGHSNCMIWVVLRKCPVPLSCQGGVRTKERKALAGKEISDMAMRKMCKENLKSAWPPKWLRNEEIQFQAIRCGYKSLWQVAH